MNAKGLERVVADISEQHQIQGPPIFVKKSRRDNNYNSSESNRSQELESLLSDIDHLLLSLSDWLTSSLSAALSDRTTQLVELQESLFTRDQQLHNLEKRARRTVEEEEQARDRERQREEEIERMREKLREREEQTRESYQREERINRQCQQIKAQLDLTRKEQEKLLIQIKNLLVEKERAVEEARKSKEREEKDLGKIK